MLDGWWGLGGPRKVGVSGCNRMDLTEARGSSSDEAGSFHILGAAFAAPYRSQQNKDSEYQGRCGVGSCCSWSARKHSYKRDQRQIAQASQGCPVDCCDPRQAVSCPHVCLPLCEAVTWRWLCPGCHMRAHTTYRKRL